MALTKVSRGILNTGVADSSDATAITINSTEDITLTGHVILADDKELRLGASTDITLKHHNSGYGHLQNTGTLYVDAEVLSFRTDNSGIGERLNINAAGLAAFSGAVTVGGTLGVTGATTTSGQILAQAGSAGAPSYAFSAQASTGMYKPGTNQLYFSVGGTRKMRMEAAQTVIENTATYVSGTLGVTGVLTADAGIDIDNFNIDGTTIALSSGDLTLDVAGDIVFDAGGQNWYFDDDGTRVFSIAQVSSDVYIGAEVSDKDIYFRVNDGGTVITAMTIDSSVGGMIGIGTTTPSAPLDVVENSAAWVGEFTQTNTDNGDGLLVQVGSTAAADYALSIRSDEGSTHVLAAKADGKVGIGTASPGYPIHVESSVAGDWMGKIKNTHATNGYGLLIHAGDDASVKALSVGNYAGAGDYLVVRGDGNIGVGTDSPAQLLHIKSAAPDIRIEDSDGGYVDLNAPGGSLELRADQGNAVGSSEISFWVDGGEKAVIDASGNFGIGTTSNTIGGMLETYNATDNTKHWRIHRPGSAEFGIGVTGTTLAISANSGMPPTSNQGIFMPFNSGNVGIGTASPSEKLHVNGAAKIDGNLYLATGSNTPYIVGGTVSTVFRNNANNASLVTILNGGNVGIGVTSPNANSKLEVAGRIRFEGGSTSLPALTSSDYDTGIWWGGSDILGFSTAGTERMRIDATGITSIKSSSTNYQFIVLSGSSSARGRVLIGRTAGELALTVSEATNSVFTGAAAGAVSLGNLTTGHSVWIGNIADNDATEFRAGGDVVFYDGAAGEGMRWDASAKSLGIGTASPTRPLHVSTNSTVDDSPTVEIEQDGAGDSTLGFNVPAQTWCMGIDNSDGDRFKIAHNNALDNGNENCVEISTDGKFQLSDNFDAQATFSGFTPLHVSTSTTGWLAAFDRNSTGSSSQNGVLVRTGQTAITAGMLNMESNHPDCGGSSTDTEFRFQVDGNGVCDGSFAGGGADYAEYFESTDNSVIPVGTTVVMADNKVRVSTGSDAASTIIGVVRPKTGGAAMIGNSPLNWQGKYLKDSFGQKLRDENDLWRLNPAFDPDLEYVMRGDRDEWQLIGLLGQITVKKGQTMGDRWIKLRDIDATVELWLVR